MTNVPSGVLPLKTARPPLAAKDLGWVVAVQGPGALTSLVRIDGSGRATCDCRDFTAVKQPCQHVAAAARLLRA